MGKPEKEIDIYAQRARNCKNVFDKESNLMRAQNEDVVFKSFLVHLNGATLSHKAIVGILHGLFFTV